jgi:hypothetical protein
MKIVNYAIQVELKGVFELILEFYAASLVVQYVLHLKVDLLVQRPIAYYSPLKSELSVR